MSPATAPYVGRFAPSPTGELHFGSLMVAVGSWLRARAQGGEWLIRIEDLDRARAIPGASDRIVQTLTAHGLVSDRPVLRQDADTTRFAQALDALIESDAAYACVCTRADVQAAGGVHRSCTAAASIPHARPPSWRLRVPPGDVTFEDALRGAQSQKVARRVGDFVLRRSNEEFTYHLAVVVADAWQGVTEVVRGGDLIGSTARQIVLQRSLGLPTPEYLHLPMVLGEAGEKLSKQARSAPVDATAPMSTLRAVLMALGQYADPAARTPAGLLESAAARFNLAALPRALTLPHPRY